MTLLIISKNNTTEIIEVTSFSVSNNTLSCLKDGRKMSRSLKDIKSFEVAEEAVVSNE